MKKKTRPLRADERYNKLKTTTCNIRLNKKTDLDIIQKLSEVPSKMGYIKSLIRSDIIANGYKK